MGSVYICTKIFIGIYAPLKNVWMKISNPVKFRIITFCFKLEHIVDYFDKIYTQNYREKHSECGNCPENALSPTILNLWEIKMPIQLNNSTNRIFRRKIGFLRWI